MANPLSIQHHVAPWAAGTRLPGYIAGLITEPAGADVEHDVTVGRGVATGLIATRLLGIQVPITKQLDAAWAAGDAAGGLDTGAVAADELYGYHVIGGPSVAADAIFTLGGGAPSLPTGYTDHRRVAWLLTDASANLRRYRQVNGGFRLDNSVEDVNDVSGTTDTYITGLLTAPPSVLVSLQFRIDCTNQSLVTGFLTEPALAPTAGVLTADAVIHLEVNANNIDSLGVKVLSRTDAGRQISYAASVSGNNLDAVVISTLGWVDDRDANEF